MLNQLLMVSHVFFIILHFFGVNSSPSLIYGNHQCLCVRETVCFPPSLPSSLCRKESSLLLLHSEREASEGFVWNPLKHALIHWMINTRTHLCFLTAAAANCGQLLPPAGWGWSCCCRKQLVSQWAWGTCLSNDCLLVFSLQLVWKLHQLDVRKTHYKKTHNQ